MNLRAAFSALWQPKGHKRLYSASEVIDSIVRPLDIAREGKYVKGFYQSLINQYSGYVKVAVSRTSTAVASVPLRVMRRTGGKKSSWDGRRPSRKELVWMRNSGVRKAADISAYGNDVEEITDPLHPLVAILRNVNPMLNGFEYIEQKQQGLCLTGNSYTALIRPSGSEYPTELWPMMPQHVEVIPRKGDAMIAGYCFGRGTEVERVYQPEDVIHFKLPNPYDPYYGLADLAACVDAANIAKLLNQAALSMLTNGVQPGVLIVAEDANDVQARQMEEALNRKHQGASKWYKTKVITGKNKLETVDIGEGAVKFLALPADKVREMIANAFDLPVSALTQDASSLASTESQDTRWKRTAIVPRLRRIADKMNEQLVPWFSGTTTGDIFLCFDDPVVEDENAETERIVKLAGNKPLLTQNEGRAKLGLPPVEGGDELNPPPPELGGAFGEEPKRAAESTEKAESDESAEKALRWSDALWKPNTHHEGKALPEAGDLERAMSELFKRLGPLLAQAVSPQGVSPAAMASIPWGRLIEETAGPHLLGVFSRGYVNAAKAVADRKPDTASMFDVKNERAQQFLERYKVRLARSISQTVEEHLRGVVSANIEAGGSISDLTAAVKDTIAGMETYGAERIARTESSRAYVQGNLAAFKEVPSINRKRWILSANPCPTCIAVYQHRGTVPVGEPFYRLGETIPSDPPVLVDYADVDGGDCHPMDRCSIVPVFEDE